MHDLRFAIRQLRKNPGFTAVAVFTLALGIGATTALFSVVDAVVLKALPYFEPERLVMVWTHNPSLNLGFSELPPAAPDLGEWRSEARSFEQIAAFRTLAADLSEQGDPERVGGVQVTANFFSLLGAQPTLGRVFSAEEEQPGNDKVAVISHDLWQRRAGGDTNILRQTITVNHERCAVIGVMPPRFSFPHGAEMPAGYALMAQTEVWRPYAAPAHYWSNGDARDLIAIGRLKRGIGFDRAQEEMTDVARRQAEAHPKTHGGWTVHLRPLAVQAAGQTRPMLFVLLGAVAFVLLIACANVANLLLGRSAARRKEMAVRVALGATRTRIVRQLVTESVLLSVMGGALGILIGAPGVKLILEFCPANIPRLAETHFDGRVLLFNLAVSLATGVLFGMVPAWRGAKSSLTEALNADGRAGTAAGQLRAHRSLIVAEVALSVVLLTGAGLMLQSFRRLQSVDPGFKPQRVVAFDLGLSGARYQDFAQVRQFYRAARARLTSVPGIRAAAGISNLPLGGVESMNYFFIEGASPAVAGKAPLGENRKITPGYFETMGVPLLRGRDFTDHDGPDQPIVCIVNETLARLYLGAGTDPIGQRLKMNRADEEKSPWFTIVGVANDVRSYGLEVPARPQIYTTQEQNTDTDMTLVVRANASPDATVERAIRAELKALDPTLPVANFRTMESLLSGAVARPRFSTFLLGLFAGTALLLAVIGLYGVVAYLVSQRTREIGIRIALGASRWNVIALVLRQGLWPTGIGLALGLAGAFALTRLLAHQFYEMPAHDPLTFLGVTMMLLVVAVSACFRPALRAARTDPMVALRHE